MRLKDTEIEAINAVAKIVFGEKITIHLFGSRTNNDLNGGDNRFK